jgi:hypothetical protein
MRCDMTRMCPAHATARWGATKKRRTCTHRNQHSSSTQHSRPCTTRSHPPVAAAAARPHSHRHLVGLRVLQGVLHRLERLLAGDFEALLGEAQSHCGFQLGIIRSPSHERGRGRGGRRRGGGGGGGGGRRRRGGGRRGGLRASQQRSVEDSLTARQPCTTAPR